MRTLEESLDIATILRSFVQSEVFRVTQTLLIRDVPEEPTVATKAATSYNSLQEASHRMCLSCEVRHSTTLVFDSTRFPALQRGSGGWEV